MHNEYNIMDSMIANYYGICVQEYINIIKSLTWSRMNFIILVALYNRDDKKLKALEIINEYR